MTWWGLVRELAIVAGVDDLPKVRSKRGGFIPWLIWLVLVPFGVFHRWFYGKKYTVTMRRCGHEMIVGLETKRSVNRYLRLAYECDLEPEQVIVKNNYRNRYERIQNKAGKGYRCK